MDSNSLRQAISVWQRLAGAGKRPATQLYHASLDASHVATFIEAVSHYSAPRFNALVGVLRIVMPHAPPRRRRPVTPKEVHLPNQAQFTALLAELDAAHRGSGGLSCRFLALTGLRIKEARMIRWDDVHADCIRVPGAVTKNGRPRSVPLVTGLADVVARLRAVAAFV